MKLKAAIIGAGSAGREQARRLKLMDMVELAAAMDVHPAASEQLCRTFGGRSFEDVTRMIETIRPDFVVVTSPNHVHARNVLDAAEAGVRNIYCEKPLAVHLPDAIRMVEAAERLDLRTSVGFTGEHPGITSIMDQVGRGELGDIRSIFFHIYRGYGFWDQERINLSGCRSHHAAVQYPDHSGGWTVHHTCHSVFVLTELAGPVRTVFGSVLSTTPDCPGEEIVHATLVFENQVTGAIIDSIGSFRGLHFGVIGTRATSMFVDDFRKRPDEPVQIRTHHEGDSEDRRTTLRYDPSGVSRLKEFVDAILSDAPSPVTFRQGLENLRLCQAILRSSQIGQAIDVSSNGQPVPENELAV